MTTGMRSAMARSMPRAIFSPTTTPMLPPMNPYSIDATTVSMRSRAPDATMTASFMPVLSMPALSRDLYGLVSVNSSGSVDTRSLSNSVHAPSNSIRSRSAGVQPEVVAAFRADVEVGGEVLVVDRLRAAGTLDPQPFRHPARLLFRRRGHRLARLLEPRHAVSAYQGGRGREQGQDRRSWIRAGSSSP